jgi:hypothetical protein
MNRLARNVTMLVLVAGLLPMSSWAQNTGPAVGFVFAR